MAPPSAPSSLIAIAASASRIDLTWVDNSNNEVNFELERSLTGVGAWSLINSPAANAVSYANTGLSQNTTYYYRIRAVNADGNSSYSSVASALTMLPGHAPLQPRMYLLQPATVFAARVNQPAAAEYPVFSVVFDGVTTGAYTDILPGMTLLLGSSAGADDYGRQRVREVSGAGATSIVVWVGRSSRGLNDGELTIVDNAFVTVLDDRRVWAKIPFIDSSGEIFKDGNLAVSDRTTDPPPVAIMGAGFAGTIDDDDVITVTFNGQDSYAVEDAATITDYLWDIADGTLDGGALTDDNITATFPPGFRYVSLEVTDSNNKTHITYRPVFARDPDDDDSFNQFQIEGHKISESGQSMTVRILADMPRATYPDGTLAMVWGYEPSGSADRNHMLMIGWLDVENASINAGRRGLTRDTSLTILDVAGRLDRLPGFPQSIADDDSRDTELIPDITWAHMVNPNLDKYLHYLLHWHSNALDVADFVWSGDGADYPFTLQSSDGQSLWAQVDRVAKTFVPDRVLTCDRAGRLAIVAEPLLANIDDRTATVQAAIDESEWSQLSFTYQRSPKVHWVRSNAVLALDYDDLPLDVESNKYIPSVYSIAPGDTPGQGLGEIVQGSQLAINQTALNAVTGHRYARANARVGLITLNLIVNDSNAGAVMDWAEIEPAWKEWITLTVSAETAAYRGLTWTTARALPKELNIRYNHSRAGLTRTIMLTVELETIGETGQTVIPPNVPVVGAEPDSPPDMGLVDGQELVAGIGLRKVYRTSDFQTLSGSGGPTWTEHTITTEDILSWVVDPFSPGYLTGTGAVNGWVVTATDIYRVTDIFGSIASTSIHTFAVALGSATTPAQEWRTIAASFGTFFTANNPWLMVVSHYADSAGHTGTWALRSVDGGATWETEVQISAFYDESTDTDARPIAVYLSPKTPGLAYAVAYTATSDPAPASGYVTTNWGATWAQKSTINTGVRLGGDMHVPWLASGDDTIYHGKMAGGVATDPDLMPGFGLFNDNTNVFTYLGDGVSISEGVEALDETAGAPFPNEQDETYLCIVAPADTVRLVYQVTWSASRNRSNLSSSVTMTLDDQRNTATLQTGSDNFAAPATYPGVSNGSFELEVSYAGVGDWPCNKDSVISDPPNALNELGPRIRLDVIASAAGSGEFAEGSINIIVTVLEIELDDATVYTPVEDPTRAFSLQRVNADTSITDVSPVSTAVNFGANATGFRIRAYDSNKSFMVASLTGNDVSGDEADDTQAVFVSDDEAVTWTEIVAPVTSTDSFAAAFAGDTEQVIYIWGPSEYMGYSDDFGATIDDRSGNLGALSATKLIGICGGPSL